MQRGAEMEVLIQATATTMVEKLENEEEGAECWQRKRSDCVIKSVCESSYHCRYIIKQGPNLSSCSLK